MPSAVVTGANKGIGYHIARRLLAQGYEVVLACRNPDLAAAAGDKLMAEDSTKQAPAGANVRSVRYDLEDPASIEAAAAAVKEMFPGGVDSVVHNAGFAYPFGSNEPSLGEQAEKTLRINFFNTIVATEAFLPVVKDGGRIVVVGSQMGYPTDVPGDAVRAKFLAADATVDSLKKHAQGFTDAAKNGTHKELGWYDGMGAAYRASKLAIGAYTLLWAKEKRVVDRGIKVNLICPGWCRTDMAGDQAPRSADDGADTPAWLAFAPETADFTGKFYKDRAEVDWTKATFGM